jgi:hypothetical protein
LRSGREEDDDEDDEDDFFDDDEEESFLDKLDAKRAAPARSRPSPARSPQASSGSSTARAPPSRGGPGGPPKAKSGGPPKRSPGGPPRSGSPPGQASSPAPAQKVAKKKSVTSVEDAPSTKVRKAKIQVDLSIFEDWQSEDRASAVDWVVGAFADGEQERNVLMQLQETGWTAEQSRAICNLAKNNGA